MYRKVNSAAIQSAHLYNVKEPLFRLYSWPFLFIYASVLYPAITDFKYYFSHVEYFYIAIGSALTIHVLTYLLCHWSLNARAFITCSKENDIKKAQMILVFPPLHKGNGSFCKLLHQDGQIIFYFQKLKFYYDQDKKVFNQLVYPCEQSPALSLFKNSKGLTNEDQIAQVTKDYGLNNFDIPSPTFKELFKEHAIAPFFIFQIFCVILWCFDEFWYYSIFTLFMLVGFESTVVYQRLRTLNEFRSLSIKPFEMYVYRKNNWIILLSDELLPGDICSIVRTNEDTAVPCDMILVDGSAIVNEAMLTGESTPLLKESIKLREDEDIFTPDGIDKNHLLYGGTKILQATPSSDANIKAPDHGCLAYVLKTGFGTAQGKLVRTMVYSTERESANNAEALLFILFLMVFAIAASAYVWIEGSKNEQRKKSKLVLDCILIITSVVPPELPMELSLAVNTSLLALTKLAIFCTEPFRIPFAGKVDICCFDKTGTLTSENLVVEGVTYDINNLKTISPADQLPQISTLVLAAAHALVLIPDGIVGDPMEKATLEAIGWDLDKDNIITSKKNNLSLYILRRFQFSSSLKRMSTISKVNKHVNNQFLVSVKGAPETIQTMLKNVPQGYEEAYKYFGRRGNRVLALAYKFTEIGRDKVDKVSRESIESELIFAGFLIFHNPLKSDSKDVIKKLNDSSHRVVMITGDNALTACHVSKEVEITTKDTLIIDGRDDELVCFSVDESVEFKISKKDVKLEDKIINNYDLCLTGPALSLIADRPLFKYLVSHVWVYARVSPGQKEWILSSMKNEGYFTLMCGDGTNDVGALKQAHIGVALLDGTPEDLDKIHKRQRIERMKNAYESQKEMCLKYNLPVPQPPPLLIRELGLTPTNNNQVVNGGAANQRPAIDPNVFTERLFEELDEEVPVLKFGDASVASPFTSKLASIESVVSIIRQGRCTLVATTQMYKILALNCLISAYSLSVLYLDGIKYGDYQATISGMLLAVCFLCISKAQPLDTLSIERPQTNIFNFYIISSVMGQFIVHIISLIYIVQQAKLFETQQPVDLDSSFEPSLLNSAVFLISLSLQVSTFAINYQGHPFRESLKENKTLYNGLLSCGFIAFACAMELFPAMNEFLSLVPFPSAFRNRLVAGLFLDFGLAYIIERAAFYMFANNQPKPITRRN